jgi:hypothetical protein
MAGLADPGSWRKVVVQELKFQQHVDKNGTDRTGPLFSVPIVAAPNISQVTDDVICRATVSN